MFKRHIIITQNHGTIFSTMKDPNLPNIWHNVSKIVPSYPIEENLTTLTGFLDQGDRDQVASIHSKTFDKDSLYFVSILGSDYPHVKNEQISHEDPMEGSNDFFSSLKEEDTYETVNEKNIDQYENSEYLHHKFETDENSESNLGLELQKQENDFNVSNEDNTFKLLRPHSFYDSYRYASIQIDLIYGLLNMRTNFERRSFHLQFSPSSHEKKCIEYIMEEEWKSQAIRLGCWEAVDLSNENSSKARDEITKILGTASSCETILHSVLICEKKLVSMWSKYDNHLLLPKDLNLLIMDSEIKRRDWIKERKEWKEKNPSKKKKKRGFKSNNSKLTKQNIEDQTSNEDKANQDIYVSSNQSEAIEKNQKELPNIEKISSQIFEGELHNQNIDDYSYTFESEVDEILQRTQEAILSPTQELPDELPNGFQLSTSIQLSAMNYAFNKKEIQAEEPIDFERDPTYDSFEVMRLSSVKHNGTFFRFAVYMARISDSMTLILIATVDGSEEHILRSMKNQISKQLKASSYMSFITVIAQHHLLTERYLHLCPGLIHFVFKDCVRQRILAPEPISIQRDENSSVEIKEGFIRHHIWKMFQSVDIYRDLGYTEMNICTKTAQYCFHEWFLDKNGNSLQVNENNIKDAVEHYELYTIYLPFVSLQAIQLYNQELMKVLL